MSEGLDFWGYLLSGEDEVIHHNLLTPAVLSETEILYDTLFRAVYRSSDDLQSAPAREAWKKFLTQLAGKAKLVLSKTPGWSNAELTVIDALPNRVVRMIEDPHVMFCPFFHKMVTDLHYVLGRGDVGAIVVRLNPQSSPLIILLSNCQMCEELSPAWFGSNYVGKSRTEFVADASRHLVDYVIAATVTNDRPDDEKVRSVSSEVGHALHV